MTSAREALERLKAGNLRFVTGASALDSQAHQTRRHQLVAGQNPFAIILGCADSRVPVELIFDQSLGDLFVIRVAGNIVTPSVVGSIEFAAEQFGTRLVVVLGHSRCGAVTATFNELAQPSEDRSPNLQVIVDYIRPSVEGLLETDQPHAPETLIPQAVRANIRAAADHLRHGSKILERHIATDGLLVVGAEYSLDTGGVAFFDGMTESS